MMQDAKISTVHRQRLAVVYVRQSSPTQLERNRESTMRQYNFVARAVALGWTEAQVHVIDEDQGVSANGLFDRAGRVIHESRLKLLPLIGKAVALLIGQRMDVEFFHALLPGGDYCRPYLASIP